MEWNGLVHILKEFLNQKEDLTLTKTIWRNYIKSIKANLEIVTKVPLNKPIIRGRKKAKFCN